MPGIRNLYILWILIMIFAVAAGSIIACGDDDDDDLDIADDDDDDGDDDDDEAGDDDDDGGDDDDDNVECTSEEICAYVVDECLIIEDPAVCLEVMDNPPDCDDAVGYHYCICDCVDTYSPATEGENFCAIFQVCTDDCWLGYCP